MNKKYQKYINYIVNDIEPPYFINMKDSYGLSPDEYKMVLSRVFKQPVTIEGGVIYNDQGKLIYYENSDGYWYKSEYDKLGNLIYFERSDGRWQKREYDEQGDITYYENSHGDIIDNR